MFIQGIQCSLVKKYIDTELPHVRSEIFEVLLKLP